MKALVVDDDLVLSDVLAFTLRREGYEVITAYDGLAAIDRWRDESPDLILLDINLPKLDGLSVCRRIRALSNTPIIILSVRGEEEDVVKGLELGADDYVTKPFSPRQLVARAQAVLRRSGTPPTVGSLEVGDLSLDLSRRELSRAGTSSTQLTPLESRLLEVLMINKGQVLSTEALIDHVWGAGRGDRVMLKQLVHRLRTKIEANESGPAVVETIRGVGYTLNLPEQGSKD
jgi:DNA-binding response OmpR family regulator